MELKLEVKVEDHTTILIKINNTICTNLYGDKYLAFGWGGGAWQSIVYLGAV
jgi:hypothetical protein